MSNKSLARKSDYIDLILPLNFGLHDEPTMLMLLWWLDIYAIEDICATWFMRNEATFRMMVNYRKLNFNLAWSGYPSFLFLRRLFPSSGERKVPKNNTCIQLLSFQTSYSGKKSSSVLNVFSIWFKNGQNLTVEGIFQIIFCAVKFFTIF